jgi:hypothetical protein
MVPAEVLQRLRYMLLMNLLELVQILEFLEVKDIFMPGTNTIYNDNQACVKWSKRCTTKGLRHIQMKENHVQENITNNFVLIHHVDGKVNLADLFPKEMKDTSHFVALRDLMMCHCFELYIVSSVCFLL